MLLLALALVAAAATLLVLLKEDGVGEAPLSVDLVPAAAEEAEPRPAPEAPRPEPSLPELRGEVRKESSRQAAVESEVELLVLREGQALVGAQLYGMPVDGAIRALGISDGEGRLQLQLSPGSWTFSASAPGCASSSLLAWLDRPRHSYALELPGAASLHGRVRDQRGAALGAGVRIYAWDVREPEPVQLLRSAFGAVPDPRLAQTSSDVQGLFHLEGLHPGRTYRIAAVGEGAISDQRMEVRPEQPVELRLVPVVARMLSFRAGPGEALPDPALRIPGVLPRLDLGPGAKQLDLETYPELWLTPLGARLESMVL